MLFKKTAHFLNRCSAYGALFKSKTVFLNTLPCAAEDVMRKEFFLRVHCEMRPLGGRFYFVKIYKENKYFC